MFENAAEDHTLGHSACISLVAEITIFVVILGTPNSRASGDYAWHMQEALGGDQACKACAFSYSGFLR